MAKLTDTQGRFLDLMREVLPAGAGILSTNEAEESYGRLCDRLSLKTGRNIEGELRHSRNPSQKLLEVVRPISEPVGPTYHPSFSSGCLIAGILCGGFIGFALDEYPDMLELGKLRVHWILAPRHRVNWVICFQPDLELRDPAFFVDFR